MSQLHTNPEAAIDDPTAGKPAVTRRWLELALRFPLRPIRTEAEYEAAGGLMGELLDGGHAPGSEEEDYLRVLSDLIADYEDEHHEVEPASPGDVLRSLIQEQGITQAELAAATGIAEANISAMLADKRGLGKATRAKLAAYFGVKPSRFVVD